MTNVYLSSGASILATSGRKLFSTEYSISQNSMNKSTPASLSWTPAISFVRDKHINVFAEPSEESAYPQMLQLRIGALLSFPEPVEVYAVCPEEVILKPTSQRMIREMREIGFGLISVDSHGEAEFKFKAIPLIQSISEADFRDRITSFTPAQKSEFRRCFDVYKADPISGLAGISNLAEAFVKKMANDAKKQGWLTAAQVKGPTHAVCTNMHRCNQLSSARSVIGGAQGYLSKYRNPAHHRGNSKRQTRQLLLNVKTGFVEGLSTIEGIRAAAKKLGLSGNM